MSTLYSQFIVEGFQKLLDEGFYSFLGVNPPKPNDSVIYHDILDHGYNPLGEVIMPTVQGEILASINRQARMVCCSYGTMPRGNLIELLYNLFYELPDGKGGYVDETKELEKYLEENGENSIYQWYNECYRYWFSLPEELRESIKF